MAHHPDPALRASSRLRFPRRRTTAAPRRRSPGLAAGRAAFLTLAPIHALLLAASAWAQGQPVTFSVTGDYPYGSSEESVLEQHVDQHNLYSPSDFFVHVGDINASSESCVESRYVFVANTMKGLVAPGFIIIGDNEWMDCSNPDQAWQWWEESFTDFEDNFCLPFTVERQAVRPENWAFVHEGVLFCGVNIPNGTAGGDSQRLQDDGDWVVFQLQDKAPLVRACVVFGHAGPSGSRNTFFDPFVQEAGNFDRPVLYVMGDLHNWRYDNPWSEPKMRRIVVERGGTEDPVQITVDMDSSEPWNIVRNPFSGNPPVLNHDPCDGSGGSNTAPVAQPDSFTVAEDDVLVVAAPGVLANDTDDDGDSLTATLSTGATSGTVALSSNGSFTYTPDPGFFGPDSFAYHANDGQGGSASALVQIDVTPLPGPPTGTDDSYATPVATLLSVPAPGVLGNDDDPDGDPLSALLETDVSQGVLNLSSDGSFTYDPGPVFSGTESFAYRVSAGGELSGIVNVTIDVGLSTQFVFEAIHDAKVKSSSPTKNYGTETTLRVRFDSPEYRSFVKFDVTGPTTVTSAKLRLYVTDTGPDAGDVHTTSNDYASGGGPWDEAVIVWDTAPAPQAFLGNLGAPNVGEWAELDVSGAVTGPGTVSFALTGNNTNSVFFSAHEGADPPQLVVEGFTGPPPQSPEITVTPAAHAYGNVVLGTGVSRSFQARNDGNADLTLGVPTLGGPDSPSFDFQGGEAGTTLAPGETHDIVVRFAPLALGPMSATLSIPSDDADEPTVAVALTGTGVGQPVPEITVTPLTHAYGDVPVGGSGSYAFDVRNDGNLDLTISSIGLSGANAAEFSIDSGGDAGTLAPGANRSVGVSFVPVSVGGKAAVLTVASDDPDEPTVDVMLSGTGLPVSGGGNGKVVFEEAGQGGAAGASLSTGPLAGGASQLYLAAVSSKPRVATTGVAGLGLTWSLVRAQCSGRSQTGVDVWMAFGDAVPGAVSATLASVPSSAHLVVTRYSGADPLGPIGDVVSGNTMGVEGSCSGGSDGASYSFDLGASAAGSMAWGVAAMRNRSHTEGAGYTELTESGFGSGGSMTGVAIQQREASSPGTIALDGTFSSNVDWAVVGIEIVAAPAGEFPDIAVLPASRDYGNVLLGTSSAPDTFTVSNTGTADLLVSSMSLAGPDSAEFALGAGGAVPFTLGPGQASTIDVSFAPITLGAKSAVLRIVSDDPNESPFDVALTGIGVDAIAPDLVLTPPSHDFGNVFQGASTAHTFQAENAGNDTLHASAVTIVGLDAGEFSISAGGGAFALAPGAVRPVEVTFAPTSTGPKSASLRFASDDPDLPQLDAPLAGTGVEAPVGGAEVLFEEAAAGGASGGVSVSTAASLAAVPGDFYLVAISAKKYASTTAVAGMGLAWSPVASQCGGRSQTGADVWVATGVPSGGPITATLSQQVSSATIVAVRYSGVDPVVPIGAVVSANTNGPAGACSGGSDGGSYALSLSTAVDGAGVFAAVAMRHKTHTPGADYVERATFQQGSGGSAASVAVMDRTVATASTVSVDGSFNGSVDWAVVGLELRPAAPLPVIAAGRGEQVVAGRPPADALDGRALASPSELARGPDVFALETIRPNPFRGETVIEYSLPVDTRVQLVIYDVTGRQVRRLVDRFEAAGRRKARWLGRDEAGGPVAAGIYFLRWEAGPEVVTKRLVLAR